MAELSYDALSEAEARRVIDTLSPHVTEARLARMEQALRTRSRAVTVVLEDLVNAHNGAAVFRSMEAFGLFEAHVVEPTEGAFEISAEVASGAHKWLDLRWHRQTRAAFDRLRARGYRIWVSDLHGDPVPHHEIDVSEPIALVFGNERDGISEAARAAADGAFRIPMVGFVESLNISVAAAITIHDVTARRRALGLPSGLEAGDARRVLAAWLTCSVRAAPELLARAGLPQPRIHRDELRLEAARRPFAG